MKTTIKPKPKDVANRGVASTLWDLQTRRNHDPRFSSGEGVALLTAVEERLREARTALREDRMSPAEARAVANGANLAMEEFGCAMDVVRGVETGNPSTVMFHVARIRSMRAEMGRCRLKDVPQYGPDFADVDADDFAVAEKWAKARTEGA